MKISIGTKYLSILYQSLSTDHFNKKLNGDLKIEWKLICGLNGEVGEFKRILNDEIKKRMQ